MTVIQQLTASSAEIRRYSRGALKLAGAMDVTPVPLDEIEQAVGLWPSQTLWEAGEDLPPGILAIIKKLGQKVLGGLAIGEKQIYLDVTLNMPRKRFVHGHEIGHKVLPWQEQAYFADDIMTLDLNTKRAMEAEANAFSADLLYGLDRFTTMADDFSPGIVAPLSLNTTFAVSAHAALRRYVETTQHEAALIVLGRYGARPLMIDQCIQSTSFFERYGPIIELQASGFLRQHPVVEAISRASAGSTMDAGEVMTLDTKRGLVGFRTDAFTNGRLNFVLVYRRSVLGRRLRLAA